MLFKIDIGTWAMRAWFVISFLTAEHRGDRPFLNSKKVMSSSQKVFVIKNLKNKISLYTQRHSKNMH